jgi:hypothetical protein
MEIKMAFLGELTDASILDPTAAIPDKRAVDFRNALRSIVDINSPPLLGLFEPGAKF